ncbi:hypothetical protein E4634_05995 [Mangrovimicrobium sediminis]|uniref:Pyridine nucleotide-disulfide oxidoreductase n=1 Tax=Mangrovimicrobium sediminis TaxID=2562682 RepID=A0A4Z0M5H7_9GAMM|nr:hypothetical protein [Haliea sp. SAOS-164]TGD74749.1 hypothetical protein E4634_05995 [Haliea sp. SAOS-164]
MQDVVDSPAVERRYARHSPRIAFRVFAAAVAALMLWAWWIRDHRYLEAESGLGYLLGIIGVSLMLLLLLYPLRKRLAAMRSWGRLASWFRLHMVLGVMGPLCILLHCNFQLGSTNSSVALGCMLLVAGSGLIGRYLYGKFHFGLYGQQVELRQVRSDLEFIYNQMQQGDPDPARREAARNLFEGCTDIIDSQRGGVSLRQLLRQRNWLRKTAKQIRQAGGTDDTLRKRQRALASLLDKLAGLRLFERLFGFWHVAHIPVFLLMVVTAIIHVVVVHWY